MKERSLKSSLFCVIKPEVNCAILWNFRDRPYEACILKVNYKYEPCENSKKILIVSKKIKIIKRFLLNITKKVC